VLSLPNDNLTAFRKNLIVKNEVETEDDLTSFRKSLWANKPVTPKPNLLQQTGKVLGAAGRGLIAGGEDAISGLANADKFQKQLMANIVPGPLKKVYQWGADVDVNARDLMEQKANEQVKAMEGSGNTEQGAFNLVRPIPNIVAAASTGPAAPLTFGVTSAGQYSREAELEGADVPQQLAYGSIMGVVEGLTEKIPLGNISKTFTQPFKRSLIAYLKNIPAEGIQEAVSEIAGNISKQFIYKPDTFMTNGELDLNKVWENGVMNPAQAGVMGMGTAALIGLPGVAMSGGRKSVQSQEQTEPIQEATPQDIAWNEVKSLQEEVKQPEVEIQRKPLSPEKQAEIINNIAKITGKKTEPLRGKLSEIVLPEEKAAIEPKSEVKEKEPLVMTQEEYLSSKGAEFMGGSDVATHRMPGSTEKYRHQTAVRIAKKMEANNQQREELRKEYQIKVESGEIRTPSRTEQLIKTANGMDENQATQAARRLLEKKGIDWKQYKPSGESGIIKTNEQTSSIPGRNSGATPQKSTVSGTNERIKSVEKQAAGRVNLNLKNTGPALGIVNNPLPGLPPKKGLSKAYSFSDPDMETEWRSSHGQTKPSIISKVKEAATTFKNKATREYEYLPRTREFAQIRSDLLQLAKQKEVSGDRAVRMLQSQLVRLDPDSMGLLERKVLIDDLMEESKKENPSLPPGFTPEKIAQEYDLKTQQVFGNLRVREALKTRKEINDALIADYTKAMKDIGFDVEDKFKNESYFRHQVLEYANTKSLMGTGKNLKTPVSRGNLKKRSGYGGSINTNYLEAEYEVMAQMLEDIQIAKTIKSVKDNYDISAKVREQAKTEGLDNWHEAIPEGYEAWQPREGHAFFMTDSIPAKLAAQLNEGLLEQVGITKDDIRRSLAVGGLRQEFVIKTDIAETLDNLSTKKDDGFFKQLNKMVLAGWKVNALFNPRRLIKYNFRNITSDGEWTMIGNPAAFKRSPQATKELFEAMYQTKGMTDELREWFQRGGMQSTLYVQELGDLNKLKIFEHLFKKYPDYKKIPQNIWERYWKFAAKSTQFREAILRYSNYLEYLDQIQSSPGGKPKNFGASVPDEVMGIKDVRDRAFWLSNDLAGAYDKVSVIGQEIRTQLIPFWSYQEVNFKRYVQYMKNQANDGRLAMAVGKHFIKSSPRIALNIGKLVLKTSALWTMLQVYNNLVHGDEEKELPPDVQARPHVIFGRDKNGKIKYFDRLGALGDFLEWFGMDSAPKDVSDLLNGRRNLGEVIQEMVKSPVNKAIGSVSPLYKLPFELLMKRSLYPDVFKPGRIRDLGVYLAKQIGLENEYKQVMGLPTRGYGQSGENTFLYSVDPRESAYYSILDEKQRFQKQVGKYQEGYSESARSNALYNLKLAMRYGDKRATQKYLEEYVMLGGTAQGMERSLKALDPLYGLGDNKKKFIGSLKGDQLNQLKMAEEFYQDIASGKKTIIKDLKKLKKAVQ
jgi:hypothetical protein